MFRHVGSGHSLVSSCEFSTFSSILHLFVNFCVFLMAVNSASNGSMSNESWIRKDLGGICRELLE
jgi:hypothetical protein